MLSLPAVNKVSRLELAQTAVSGPGDKLFAVVGLGAPGRDYLVRTGDQRKLISASAGSKGRCTAIFNNIALANLDADAATLWTLLKAQLFNQAHVERQREASENFTWQER
ncbi:hypothetical protein NDN08_001321 [Rhodosorus marinus]|uniref:Uncharacterized protein n=1 Tax=Rhodosorus marinus TaxID=101924 RepID=A0AAV8UQK0_9RHOD|nr:hypothetical protein NDN08_001321 [Rhodosorus marinus]